MAEISMNDRFAGAFFGFAVGDAFGYPARDMTYEQLCERFEPRGCLELAVSRQTSTALFTDATQLMLFTNEGILWADGLSADGKQINYSTYVFYAYQLWLYTQTKTVAGEEYAWLFDKDKNPFRCRLLKIKALYKNRYTEQVTLDALLAAKQMNYGKLVNRLNNNSDNGGLKRVLPAGLYFNYDTELAFRLGADFAAITHTSPTGYLAAGAYAAIIAEIINGSEIDRAVTRAMKISENYEGYQEVYVALENALRLVENDEIAPLDAIKELGLGKKADSALAIAVFCAILHEENFKNAIRLAVNHDGDSSVCAALCGSILGAKRGKSCIPKKWPTTVQQDELIEESAERLKRVTAFNEEEETDEEE